MAVNGQCCTQFTRLLSFPALSIPWLVSLAAYDMAVSDKLLGGLMMATALFVFTYYTAWAILLPFFDEGNPVHSFFPPREWAIRLPAFLFVVGLAGVGSFIGLTIVKENRKKAQKARLRTA